MRKPQPDRAFTLIELLVVLANIAILAAILFPVFARAREVTRRSACAANLRQIAAAVRAYMLDYDEAFPRKGDTGFDGFDESWSGHDVWYPGRPVLGDQLAPYIRSERVWECPSDPAVRATPRAPGWRWSSYHFRHFLSSPPVYDWGFEFTDASLSEPAGVFMFSETSLANHDHKAGGRGWSNFAFADGHVRAVQNGRIVAPTGNYHWPRRGWAVFNPPAMIDPNPDF